MLTTTQIRQTFLAYFAKHQHVTVPSSSLVPLNDPSLLFTNAGMVQFKEVFLGQDKPSYQRAASVQRCVRAGGKHNDLENVGYTTRHHTFFEMLGNFSFGDYFKREAIQFAWDFLTKELALPADKLWVSVFQDDQESYDIWVKDIKFDAQRISRCGEQDNFWMMGDTGPCGPCSEIFYDHGAQVLGGPPGSATAEGDRYTEIWNMVFMQYQRFADGSQILLPRPSVDTGMGLERIAAVMQNVTDNYQIDIFQHLITATATLANLADLQHTSLRVIADHIRAACFLIVDGVLPANEGRGYVLRRIIRRALRHGNKIGLTQVFFYKLVRPLAEVMGTAYAELWHKQTFIEQILANEEEQFVTTLANGLKILEQAIAKVTDKMLPGEMVFKLYDTYGFPLDMTADIARERDLQLDLPGFERLMQQQRQQSQQASQFNVDYTSYLAGQPQTHFSGYETLQENQAIILALFKANQPVASLQADESGRVVLDRTPFYAESGGQVGDAGKLILDGAEFTVYATHKIGQSHLHHGVMFQGSLAVGDVVTALVSHAARQAIKSNHSATHLLHAALRQVLGKHIAQKGSLVDSHHLRFDFLHPGPISPAQLLQIEDLVNEKIRENLNAATALMSLEAAKQTGALSLFNEKYSEQVRVLTFGNFSSELCGGTHVQRTGDIGVFMIKAETGIAAGIRRIEAITGAAVLAWLQTQRHCAKLFTEQLHTQDIDEQLAHIKNLQEKVKTLEQQTQSLTVRNLAHTLQSKIDQVNGIKILISDCNIEPKLLRELLDCLKVILKQAVIVLTAQTAEKISVVVGVTDNLTHQIKAHDLVKLIINSSAGKGGGKADFAQAGGMLAAPLSSALDAIRKNLLATLK